ncbi:MAG: DNA mismatch repair endonuclease MutL, partial [Duncaniella sp.]|nr:DNA mismatch repair endonuclease MutL [Duncaniella sp.]
ADSITIILKDAGRTLIQVIDNGSGMSDTDARLAFERHATSKIARADDLFSLHTMGFRGEALASIAAIAQVELRTMLKGASIGTRLLINGSKFESQEADACAPGSNLMVKNLFFNVPARRKFLKKDSVELSAIMREFERLALVNIGVDFTLISNDTTLHSLMRGSMKKRVCDLFGKNLDKQLIPIETDTSIVSINGFIGLPENARRRNPLQYFMVNGRNMRHPYFHKAVMQCYERLIPPDAQPNYFINLHVDPETIDVNIHPTKNEIKFENEQGIWQILNASIRDSLGRFNVGPSIDFDREDAPEIPVFNPTAERMPEIEIDPAYNPFSEPAVSPADFLGPDISIPQPRNSSTRTDTGSMTRPATGSRPSAATDWARLYDDFMRKRDEGLASIPSSEATTTAQRESRESPASLPIDAAHHGPQLHAAGNSFQYRDTYILTPSRDGLMVIDQHRAHLRVLYDSYLAKASEQKFVAQATMFPDVLELSGSQSALLTDIRPRLTELGFVITPRGNNTWSVDGIPSVMADTSARDMVLTMIDNIASTGLDPESAMHEQFALSMARAGAIRRGQPLTSDDIDRLLSDLFRSHSPALTPDGKKIFTIISTDYISSLLG